MKKVLFGFVFVFAMISGFSQAISLDEGIAKATDYIIESLPKGTKLVILSYTSDSKDMSDYLVDELTTLLVNKRTFEVLDRANLALLQNEMKFQMSGEVSDETAQAIGKKLGAESIVSGSFEQVGNEYKYRTRIIKVSTAAIQGLISQKIISDETVYALLTGGTVQPVAKTKPAKVEKPVTAKPATTESTAPYNDFTFGQRFVASAINPLLGLGSWVMKDRFGGIVVASGEIIGIALLGVYNNGWKTVETDTGTEVYNEYSDGVMYGGAATLAGALLFGFIRPFFFTKPMPITAFGPNAGLNVELVSQKNSTAPTAVSASYTIRY